MEDRAIVALYWKRAETLSAFLAKITRNLSLDRYDAKHAEKRGGGEVPLLLDELAEVIADEAAFPAALLVRRFGAGNFRAQRLRRKQN